MAKKFKVTLSVLLAALLCCALALGIVSEGGLNLTASAVETVSVWDGNLAAAGWLDTESDKAVAPSEYVEYAENKTITLGSAAALAYFSHEVYADVSHELDGYTVTLTVDIDLGGENNLWMPIGTTERSNFPTVRFSGVFDGNGHTISNFSSKRFYEAISYDSTAGYYIAYTNNDEQHKLPFGVKDGEEYCYGLFGVTADITVRDLTVKDVMFDMPGKNAGASKTLVTDGVGSIIGFNAGSCVVERCTAGTQDGADSIKNVMVTGGLVGRAYGYNQADGVVQTPYQNIEFIDCVNFIDLGIENEAEKKGGIAGFVQSFSTGKFVNCNNYGDLYGRYVGGIVAHFMGSQSNLGKAEISNCVNYGNVTARYEKDNAFAGGIIGLMQFNASHTLDGIAINDCRNYGTLQSSVDNGWSGAGGVTGWLQLPAEHEDKIIVKKFFNYGDITSGLQGGGIFGWISEKSPAFSGGFCGANTSGTNQAYIGSGVASTTPEYFINASNIPSTSVAEAGTPTETATLIYDETDNTVVVGAKYEGDEYYKVEIPSSVTKIELGAFAGQSKLTEVTFEADGTLSEIGDWAFAGTGIKEIALPSGVEKIGVAAFGDCGALKKAELPNSVQSVEQSAFANCASNLNIFLSSFEFTVGKYALPSDVYIIASDMNAYNSIKASANFEKYRDAATYPVTLEYYNLSSATAEKVAEETRLFGKAYNVVKDADGQWAENANITAVGPTAFVNTSWHTDENCTVAATLENVGALLAAEGMQTIKLYARTLGISDLFIPRNDIVYDENATYGTIAINALLSNNSKKVTNETVEITAFEYPDGTAETTSVPESFHNAGTYTVKITGDDASETTVKIVIHRAKVNLADRSALEWRVNGDISLLDRTIYIYNRTDGGKYPSLTLLRDGQRPGGVTSAAPKELAVIDSVVRASGGKLTLMPKENGFTATGSAHEQKDVGVYSSTYTLTALNENYVLEKSGTIINADARGLSVTINDDGTATVTKIWYAVNMNNWLVSSTGDYKINSRGYGSPIPFEIPKLVHGGNDDNGKITYALYDAHGELGEFTNVEFSKYMNGSLPAGTYRLRVNAPEVTYTETDASGNETTVQCARFYQDVTFTVEKARFNGERIAALLDALNGKRFECIVGETNMRDENAAVQAVVNGILEELRVAQPVNPKDSVWAPSDIKLQFNLASAMNNEYNSIFIKPSTAGVYTYYFRVAANNYIDVASREDSLLSFTVAAYGIVNLPSSADLSKVYNGEKQTADIVSGEAYSVTGNDGGVDAGEYAVTLTLNEPDCHLWAGQTLDNKSASSTIAFVISKALNEFMESPDIVRWVAGKFDEKENGFIGAAKFGVINYVITDVNDKVIYDISRGIDKRASMKAGVYILKATVDGNDNYNGLTESFTVRILAKAGLAWWATLIIVLGSLLVAAAIIFILWKKGVFQILTRKLTLAISTRASVEATIASVIAAKKMEEGRKSREAAIRKERREEAKKKAAEQRALPAEERAAALEAKAQAEEAKAEKLRAKIEAMRKRAERMREEATAEEAAIAESEAAATENENATKTVVPDAENEATVSQATEPVAEEVAATEQESPAPENEVTVSQATEPVAEEVAASEQESPAPENEAEKS